MKRLVIFCLLMAWGLRVHAQAQTGDKPGNSYHVSVQTVSQSALPPLYTDSLPHDWKDQLIHNNLDLSRRIRKASYQKKISRETASAMNKAMSAYSREMQTDFSQNKRWSLTQEQYENILKTQQEGRRTVESQVPIDDHPELSPMGAPADGVADLMNRTNQLENQTKKAWAMKWITQAQLLSIRKKCRTVVHKRMVDYFRQNKYNDITADQYNQLNGSLDALGREIPTEKN
jgi:hypothetical protein